MQVKTQSLSQSRLQGCPRTIRQRWKSRQQSNRGLKIDRTIIDLVAIRNHYDLDDNNSGDDEACEDSSAVPELATMLGPGNAHQAAGFRGWGRNIRGNAVGVVLFMLHLGVLGLLVGW